MNTILQDFVYLSLGDYALNFSIKCKHVSFIVNHHVEYEKHHY